MDNITSYYSLSKFTAQLMTKNDFILIFFSTATVDGNSQSSNWISLELFGYTPVAFYHRSESNYKISAENLNKYCKL